MHESNANCDAVGDLVAAFIHDLHIPNDPPPLESIHSSNLACSFEQDDDDDNDDDAVSSTRPSAIITSGVDKFEGSCDGLGVGQLEGGFLDKLQIFFSIQALAADILEYTLGR
jgi:hypothetical protein